MKKVSLFFAFALLLAACKKEEVMKTTIEPDLSPKVITYTMQDSTFSYWSYTHGPAGYKEYSWDSVYVLTYTQSLTIDTLSDMKQLVYCGNTFIRLGQGNRFEKIAPAPPLKGQVIWITLKENAISVDCTYETWQTWKKSYTVKGILK
ncbi:MAG TPA: hypothetical protein VL092_10025 [Chitinophagaceae bacterium]|nr:hypothetical protein [Chitinophagaceae bacterium]